MHDISDSKPTSLPTTRQLIRSTIIAILIAGVLLVGVVLPAEYGVDPTGVGSTLGLTEMGRIKASLAKEAEQEQAAVDNTPATSATNAAPAAANTASVAAEAPAAAAPSSRSDVVTITLQPGQGREIKLAMREGARVNFSWSTDKGVVNFDEHADSETPRRDYHGYRKGSGVAKDEGVLTAAFEGWHGWFWRNRGTEPLTVTLRVNGDYREFKEVK
jgi:erythromycin esterase-like protein